MRTGSLPDLGLISATAPCVALSPASMRSYCAGRTAVHFYDPFRQIATAPPFASLFPQTIGKPASLSRLARYDRPGPADSQWLEIRGPVYGEGAQRRLCG